MTTTTTLRRTRGRKASKVTPETPTIVTLPLATVPEMSMYDNYVSRNFGNFSELEIYERAYRTGWNVLNEGPTGCGKTSSAVAFAAAHQKPFYAISPNVSVEPSQLFGKYVRDNGEWVWQDGPVTDMIRNGGVLLISEVNFLPTRTGVVLFPFLDFQRQITLMDHKNEVIRAHRPDCWCDLEEDECEEKWLLVIADMNPGYAGTGDLNAAFRNRFPIQLVWDYDESVEAQLIEGSVLRALAKQFRVQNATGDIETPMATNMLIEFEAQLRIFDFDFALANLVRRFEKDERDTVRKVLEAKKSEMVTEYEALWKPTADDGFEVFGTGWVFPDAV